MVAIFLLVESHVINQDFKVNESNLKMYQWRVLQFKLETF